jgi:ketosteroid isomerase-like protein
MSVSHEHEKRAAAPEPLALVRRLYEAWNAGDVAGAAELLAPDVRWESFRGARPLSGPGAIQATLAGPSGGTWRLAPVAIDLLVGVVDHVIAVSRRGGPQAEAEADRLEVWTMHDGRAVHYRGYPLDVGLAVLSETTRSHKLEAVCRAVLAFNRGDAEGWLRFFTPDVELVSRPGQAGFVIGGSAADFTGRRIGDVRILAEAFELLVVSATVHERDLASTLNLVIRFAATRARRIVAHATAEEALASAAGGRFERGS